MAPWTVDWPGSSLQGILQARMLEFIPFSRESSWSRDWTQIACNLGRFFTVWATKEASSILYHTINDLSFFSTETWLRRPTLTFWPKEKPTFLGERLWNLDEHSTIVKRQCVHLCVCMHVNTGGQVLKVQETYMTQNNLELKLPSRSSPPFYAKQRTLSPKGKKKKRTIRLITPSSQPVQPLAISRIPCPSC